MSVRTHNNAARKPFVNQMVARGGLGVATLTGALTLDAYSAQYLLLDPGGASRNVTLPPVEDGLFFCIVNAADAAENLVLKNAAASTIGTIGQGESGEFWSDGTSWVLLRRYSNLPQGEAQLLQAQGTILTAAVKTLNATPVAVIPAPGAGLYVEVHRCRWMLDFGTVAYDGAAAGETLSLHYTNGAAPALVDPIAGNAIGSAAADYNTMALAVPEVIPVANAAVVAALQSGEWFAAAGDSPLKYLVDYRIRTLQL